MLMSLLPYSGRLGLVWDSLLFLATTIFDERFVCIYAYIYNIDRYIDI